ncbi:MAG: sigma factor-like helix-turn-helix DNA-binding protein [Candidatus Brocadiia bacterium]
MDRRDEHVLPPAWRGVASPRYMRLARWLSLVEELGGMRAPGACGQEALGSVVAAGGEAGKADMSLLTTRPETGQMDELRRFVTEECTRHERLVLLLFYADGLGLAEIAHVLDLPQATVAQLFEKTLTVLRERFG